MATGTTQTLRLKFHGRIIDQLVIQMYQSPVAALSELIANAWDADTDNVWITLPCAPLTKISTIEIRDDGDGMTLKECEERYLNIGYCRRSTPTERSAGKQRPILGRKGIGKFAGFGIAQVIRVETVSRGTGEKTVFELNLASLRSDQYLVEGGVIDVLEYLAPDLARIVEHGTKIQLKELTLGRAINSNQFATSMARRFLLHQ